MNLNELNYYLESYLSLEVSNSEIQDYFLKQTDNYLRYGDSLYCLQKTESSSVKYIEEKSNFKIKDLESDTIVGIVTTNYKEVFVVTLSRFLDDWQITEYEKQ